MTQTVGRRTLLRRGQALIKQRQPAQKSGAISIQLKRLPNRLGVNIHLPAQQAVPGLAGEFRRRRGTQQVIVAGLTLFLSDHLLPQFQCLSPIERRQGGRQPQTDQRLPLLHQPALQRLHRQRIPHRKTTGYTAAIPLSGDTAGQAKVRGENYETAFQQRLQRRNIVQLVGQSFLLVLPACARGTYTKAADYYKMPRPGCVALS